MADKKKKAKKTEPVDEVEEQDEDVELEELDEDAEESDEAPAKGGQDEVEFGASDLAKYLSKALSKKEGKTVTVTPRELRAFIRKLAREDKPRVQREVVAGNRSRYNWEGGLENPEVKRIIKAVLGGELAESKKAALEKLKSDKAAKKAAGEDAPAKKKKGKGKDKVVEADDDDEVEEIEDDEIELDDDDD